MRLPKKPKLKSLPKRPKASASISTWKNYDKNCKEVQNENRKRKSDWEKRVKQIKSDVKMREKIQDKTKGMGRI